MSILVVGSLNTDLTVNCDRAPEDGETLPGSTFNIYMGGKGANQAVAAKRMGSDVYMAGCLGRDSFGDKIVDFFDGEGISTRNIKRTSDTSSGVALISIDKNGQNRIIVVPGANYCYYKEDLNKIEDIIKGASYIVTQFEQREEIVEELASLSKKHNKKLIINPAPARPIRDEVLDGLYLITPNETELGIILNKEIKTMDDYLFGAKELINKGVENVVITLGKDGSLLVSKEKVKNIPSFKVKPIDTVGAGDCFTGTIAAMLDQGKDLEDAIKIATKAASLEIQKPGAIPSMPNKEEVFKEL